MSSKGSLPDVHRSKKRVNFIVLSTVRDTGAVSSGFLSSLGVGGIYRKGEGRSCLLILWEERNVLGSFVQTVLCLWQVECFFSEGVMFGMGDFEFVTSDVSDQMSQLLLCMSALEKLVSNHSWVGSRKNNLSTLLFMECVCGCVQALANFIITFPTSLFTFQVFKPFPCFIYQHIFRSFLFPCE